MLFDKFKRLISVFIFALVAAGAFVGFLDDLDDPDVYGVGLDLVADLLADLHERLAAFGAFERAGPKNARLRDVFLEVDAPELAPPRAQIGRAHV